MEVETETADGVGFDIDLVDGETELRETVEEGGGPPGIASSYLKFRAAVPVLLVRRLDKLTDAALREVMVELPTVEEERAVTTQEQAELTRETLPRHSPRYEGMSVEEVRKV